MLRPLRVVRSRPQSKHTLSPPANDSLGIVPCIVQYEAYENESVAIDRLGKEAKEIEVATRRNATPRIRG